LQVDDGECVVKNDTVRFISSRRIERSVGVLRHSAAFACKSTKSVDDIRRRGGWAKLLRELFWSPWYDRSALFQVSGIHQYIFHIDAHAFGERDRRGQDIWSF